MAETTVDEHGRILQTTSSSTLPYLLHGFLGNE